MKAQFPFDNSYARLPERFFTRTEPTLVREPQLIGVNESLAIHLGLDPAYLAGAHGVEVLAGNRVPDTAEPIAQAYAGHQFGQFVPQLGDGRAILLGEVIDGSGARRDVQLKGSGRTPFSRGGDGRAAIGPVLREYVVSEAMAALGIATTRTLGAVTTGEHVQRERVLPGAVLTRVASSHIRVGTFQFFASRGDVEAVRILADYVIERHYPDAVKADRPYRALLETISKAQAELISDWLLVGFIHGVMNTDNMSIAGETIDYGPCAFMDEYNPATSFSAIDRFGRYAYGNQPAIGVWNLARLAECLLPLLDDDTNAAVATAQEALSSFGKRFEAAQAAGLRRKLGLFTERDGDVGLAERLLKVMADNAADFTLTFRRLCDAVEHPSDDPSDDAAGPAAASAEASVRDLFIDKAAFDEWATSWRARLAEEPTDAEQRRTAMQQVNPAFIPRNHRVEAVIRAAVDGGDFAPFHELLAVLSRPYDDQPAFARYMEPPQEHERVHQTFCGT